MRCELVCPSKYTTSIRQSSQFAAYFVTIYNPSRVSVGKKYIVTYGRTQCSGNGKRFFKKSLYCLVVYKCVFLMFQSLEKTALATMYINLTGIEGILNL